MRRGLSPRVRGNRLIMAGSVNKVRTIPACAGEPRLPARNSARCMDYPRVCGGTARHRATQAGTQGLSPRVRGNPSPEATSAPDAGLSPRVRGNLGRNGASRIGKGTIPACAGEPLHGSGGQSPGEDYPRVCGGTKLSDDLGSTKTGLSPRVRGNPRFPFVSPTASRTIPACAGEPPAGGRTRCQNRDYPRVCGGTRCRRHGQVGTAGLSPRVRGNLCQHPGCEALHGTIPACAGEPASIPALCTTTGDYPRVCGGTPFAGMRVGRIAGLSPRVRGNLSSVSMCQPLWGTIPACAGEPRSSPARSRRSRDYPRVCGGTQTELIRDMQDWGLSPRVRGNRTAYRSQRE